MESIETKIFRKIKWAKNDLLFSVDMFARFNNMNKELLVLFRENRIFCCRKYCKNLRQKQ